MADDSRTQDALSDARTGRATVDAGAPPAPEGESPVDYDNVRTAYEQLCLSYRAIDDFRAKLLGFLPLVTGGGLILLTGRSADMREEYFRPVGLFGIAVTAGLLAYELFGIRKCHALIEAGQDLEDALGLPRGGEQECVAGQFRRRPQNLLTVVNEPFAAAAIYPAVLAAWLYLALHGVANYLAVPLSLLLFVSGFLLILRYDRWLTDPDDRRVFPFRRRREADRQPA